MKTVFFSLKPFEGNYGGGMFFVKNLINYLQSKNYNVTFKLEDNIDIIFIIDPRKAEHKKYSIDDIINYKKNFPNVKIIQRVNECDIKREKSINIEPKLIKTMKNSDYIVFVSKWLQTYFLKKYNLSIKSNSILNGCNREHFFPLKNKKINNKIKIVTHHFSDNYLKGFHIYNKIDKYLSNHNDFEFIYIGNYNKKYKPTNIKLLQPTSGIELGNLLRKCDIYLTATQNEPGAMHYLEGMSCGLPVLFCKGGGGATEICSKFGEEFNDFNDLFLKLDLIKNNYDYYRNKINYEFLGSKRCCNQYLEIIDNLI